MTNPPTTIKVAIADSQFFFRNGLKEAISHNKEMTIIAESENGMHLLSLLKNVKPDVILLELRMPTMDGITALLKIKRTYPKAKVIVMANQSDNLTIIKLMEVGANSYLVKDFSLEIIYEAIKSVCEHNFYFTELINKALLANIGKSINGSVAPQDVHLSEEEMTVLKLMCEDKSTKEIGAEMNLSSRAIENIRYNIQKKTGARSAVVGLVMFGAKIGLI